MKSIRNLILFSFVLLSATLHSSGASAAEGITLNPSILYYNIETTQGTTTKDTFQNIHLNAGYTFGSGLYLGLGYTMNTLTSGSATQTDSGYGPSLGYIHSGGFYGIFTYLLSPTRKTSTPDRTYSGGTGMRVDLGYMLKLGSVGIGPQLSYLTTTYKKSKSGGGAELDLSPEAKVTETLLPMLAFQFMF